MFNYTYSSINTYTPTPHLVAHTCKRVLLTKNNQAIWARGKRRGFCSEAAARHSSDARQYGFSFNLPFFSLSYCSAIGSTRIWGQKSCFEGGTWCMGVCRELHTKFGLIRLNPDFWKNDRVEPAQPKFWGKIWVEQAQPDFRLNPIFPGGKWVFGLILVCMNSG